MRHAALHARRHVSGRVVMRYPNCINSLGTQHWTRTLTHTHGLLFAPGTLSATRIQHDTPSLEDSRRHNCTTSAQVRNRLRKWGTTTQPTSFKQHLQIALRGQNTSHASLRPLTKARTLLTPQKQACHANDQYGRPNAVFISWQEHQ